MKTISFNEFDKAVVMMNCAQAKRVLNLINDHTDFQKLTIGEVMDLNSLSSQLEDIIEAVEGPVEEDPSELLESYAELKAQIEEDNYRDRE